MNREQRVAQRGDGGNGIHNLVGQHAGQAHPRVQLLGVKLVVDIVQGDDADVLVLQGHLRDAEREVHGPPFVAERDLLLFSRLDMLDGAHQPLVDFLQLVYVGEYREAEEVQGRVVVLIDVAPVVHDDDARADRVQDEFVVFFPLDGIGFCLEKNLGDAVQRLVYQLVLLAVSGRPVFEGVVVVVYRVEHEGEFAHVPDIKELHPCQPIHYPDGSYRRDSPPAQGYRPHHHRAAQGYQGDLEVETPCQRLICHTSSACCTGFAGRYPARQLPARGWRRCAAWIRLSACTPSPRAS